MTDREAPHTAEKDACDGCLDPAHRHWEIAESGYTAEWIADRVEWGDGTEFIAVADVERNLPEFLRDLARRCHNGASDPFQEFYDEGMSPLLDRLADALDRMVTRPEAVDRG